MKTTLLTALIVLATFFSQGQWSYTDLSEGKEYMGSAAMGNKIYFAGGYNGFEYLTEVEVYDLSTGDWDTAGNLSVGREIISGVSCGSLIFFAGGFDWVTTKNVVDIYDTQTQQWSVEYLSLDRLSIATVSHGSKVMFAGGFRFPSMQRVNIVDIYDTETELWEVEYLSQGREGIASAVVGELAIFAGGLSSDSTTNVVDIYNFSTSTWSIDTLSLARTHASATTIGTKVIIAGGSTSINNPTDRVDIYDASTGTWDTASLSVPRAAINNGATVDGKAYFAGGGNFTGSGLNDPQKRIDIYDPDSNTWMIDVLTEPLVNHSLIGVGNYLVVAGGKNDLGNLVSTVEIFYDPETGISSQSLENVYSTIYPNPCNNILKLSIPNVTTLEDAVIYSQTGQKVLQEKPLNYTLDISTLQHGMYIIELETEQGKIREKLIVQ